MKESSSLSLRVRKHEWLETSEKESNGPRKSELEVGPCQADATRSIASLGHGTLEDRSDRIISRADWRPIVNGGHDAQLMRMGALCVPYA